MNLNCIFLSIARCYQRGMSLCFSWELHWIFYRTNTQTNTHTHTHDIWISNQACVHMFDILWNLDFPSLFHFPTFYKINFYRMLYDGKFVLLPLLFLHNNNLYNIFYKNNNNKLLWWWWFPSLCLRTTLSQFSRVHWLFYCFAS